MLILIVLLVVLVGAALAAAVAGVASGDGRHGSLLGGAGPSLVLVAGVGAVVVLGAAAMLLVGFRGGGDGGGGDGEPATARPTVTAPVPEKPAAVASAVPAGSGPEVTIFAGAPAAVVDRLPERAVLVVTARGFKPGAGEVAQCGVAAEAPRDCVNRFPVRFDGGGTALFQYLVSDRVHPEGGCGAGRPPCLVVVFGAHGAGRGSLFTVFHDTAPPPGRVTVEPGAGLSGGDVVTVRASGYPPAIRLVAAQCPPGEGPDGGRCGRAVSSRTGPDGRAVLRLTVHTGEVGGAVCGPRQACSVRVAADAPIVPVSRLVTFSAGPAARYDTGRLAAGLALALLLLALAWRLVRASDWRGPAEASTPEMDQAVLDD